ncbi:MAG: cache domain-containing protein, partial [Methanoregulaceae archaeon]|nr:cache domain-containing protein [Methanoregulaceae archaeon]
MLTVCMLVAGCTYSPQQKPLTQISPPATSIPDTTSISSNGSVQPAAIQTTQGLIAFVDKAVVYARENGKVKAIAAFNDPGGEFTRDGLYIFAEGLDGTALAEPFEHEIVGKNILDLEDPYGIPIVRNLVDTARNEKGLVSYNYRNPSKNYTIQPKV